MVQVAPGSRRDWSSSQVFAEEGDEAEGRRVGFSLPQLPGAALSPLCLQLPHSTPITHPDPAVPALAATRWPPCSSSGQHCPAHLAIRDRISLMRTTSFSCCSGLLSMALCSLAM